MALLPDSNTNEDNYVTFYRDVNTWLPAMRAICRRHGLNETQLEFAPPGTHVVFRVKPELYIKLYFPPWRQDHVTERPVLHKLSQQPCLPIPVPRIVFEGEIEGWPYIIVAAVEGRPLNQVWHTMSMSDKQRITAQCGELMSALHLTQTEELEEIAVDWPTFVHDQIKKSIDQVIQANLGDEWSRAVVEFLEDLPPLFEPDFQPVLLNADVTDEHILVSRRKGGWEMTGLIDFGDSMLGHPHYEFAAPGCCITRNSPDLQKTMLLAYGYSADQLDTVLSEKLMAYTLIHRFINIPDLLSSSHSNQPENFAELKNELWAFW
ncbi:aminoglycoside phosphotransferase family protein [Candidatus Poribacteria bacterium]